MKRYRMLILTALAAAALSGCGKIRQYADTAQIGSGLVAKTICSGVFVQDRAPADIWREELNKQTDSRLSLFKAKIDAQAKTVSADAFGLGKSQAVFRDGLGCAVAPGKVSQDVIAARGPTPAPAPHMFETGAAADPQALNAALDWAFAPPATGPNWRTRAVLVVKDGKIVAERYAEGFGPQTKFWSASMAKTVSAMLVGILAAEGKMDLSASGLYPDWTDPARGAITPRHLLGMESGLAFNEEYGAPTDVSRMLYASASAAAIARARPSAHQPGSQFYYSSGDTNMLMQIARQRSGLSLADWHSFPRRALFDPIGLESALFETDAAGDFIGSTYIYATARDWARLGLLMAQDGQWQGKQILPPGWVAQMTMPGAVSGGQYGLQTWIDDGAIGSPARIYSMRGYGGQRVTVAPADGAVIVRLGWNVDPKAFPHDRLVREVLTALKPPKP
ncbi:MAG: serine hydrolase domain-containing protein [Caulobacterales bacterium]